MSKPRAEGTAVGLLRGASMVALAAYGVVRIDAAYRQGGEAGAQAAFRKIAGHFCDLLGLAVESAPLPAGVSEVRVANHTSYTDIFVLAYAGAGRFLSRHDVADWVWVGRVAKQVGTLFVNRSDRASRHTALRQLVNAATEPSPLVVFPEGRTNVGELLPFQQGAFLAASRAGVPVRPLAIRYADAQDIAWVGQAPLLPNLWKRLSGPSMNVRVEPLTAILPSDGVREAAQGAREAISGALEQG